MASLINRDLYQNDYSVKDPFENFKNWNKISISKKDAANNRAQSPTLGGGSSIDSAISSILGNYDMNEEGNPQVTRTSGTESSEGTSKTRGTTKTSTEGKKTSESKETRDTQAVTDDILNLLNIAAQQLATGSNNTLNTIDNARLNSISNIERAINNFNTSDIMNAAEANVQKLTENLMQNVLPQITGAVEASGTQNNALAGLLATEKATETGYNQALIREQARSNAQREFITMLSEYADASNVDSAAQNAITALIDKSRGTIDRGTIDKLLTEISNTKSTVKENSTTNTSSSATSESAGIGTGSGSGGSSRGGGSVGTGAGNTGTMEKLALIQALMPPFMNIGDLTNPFGTDYGQKDLNALLARFGV